MVTDPFEAALGIGDGVVELRHLPFGGGHLGRFRRQQIAALDGAEIGRKIVEVAERARVGQPHVGNVGRKRLKLLKRQMLNRPSTTTNRKNPRKTAVR